MHPLYFDHLIGHDVIKKALCQPLLPQALLFSGPDGVGKTHFAKAFALQRIACSENMEVAEYKIQKGVHPDLREYFPMGKLSQHPIESIRALTEEMATFPYEGKAKVFLIHEAHRMLPPAANALLKSLEEPPAHSFIILISSMASQLLGTIVSRCRIFRFLPIPDETILSFFMKKHGLSGEKAKELALSAHGSMAEAWHLFHHPMENEGKRLIGRLLHQAPFSYFTLRQTIAHLEKLYEDRKELEYLSQWIWIGCRDLQLPQSQTQMIHNRNGHPISIPALIRSMRNMALGLERGLKWSICLEQALFDLDLVL